MDSGKVLLGVLAGAAVGATLGILFAPDKGSSTRRKITQKGENYVDDLQGKFNEFIDGITNKFETMRAEATHMAEKWKDKAEAAEAKVTAATK